MSVVEAKLKFGGLSGKDELNLGRRHYTQKWLIRTDNPADGKKTVLDYAGVPQYGTYYKTTTEFDSFAFLRSRDAELDSSDSSLIWVGTFEFDTIADSGQGNQGNSLIPPPQPYDEPVVAEWDSHEEKEPAYFAYSDADESFIPITNSAGDLLDPPPERYRTIQVLRLKKNLADFDFIFWSKYSNAINSDSWLGFAPGMVLFKPPKANFVSQRGIGYWDTSFEFHIDYRGWYHYRWDAGVREFIPAGHLEFTWQKPGYNYIKNDGGGTFVTEPVLLDGNGRRLIGPQDKPKDKIRDAVFFRFRTQPRLPFGPLGII